MTDSVFIAGRRIGPTEPPYIVAEISANHGGDIGRALRLVEIAKASGADAVKLQTYTPETLTIDHDGPGFAIEAGLWQGRTLFDLYREAHTPWEWHAELFAKAQSLGLTIFSTPFDDTAVDLLETLGAPAYKIASFEILDLALIRRVAATGKPTIMSTGMASTAEIDEAVSTFRDNGTGSLILLHCVSGYPTPAAQSNLRRIPKLAQRYGCCVGLSDHTLGTEAAVAATALGACLIEKHFTFSRDEGGPDAAFSLEPSELADLVRSTHSAHDALGDGSENRSTVEQQSMAFRRSIYIVKDVAEREILSPDNVRVIRPGFGLAPRHLPEVIGRRAKARLARGTPLSLDLLEDP